MARRTDREPGTPEARSGPFDVAIAGAGLTGSSLALRLATAGASVALLDAQTFPREKLCGEYLSPECWGVLERLGLAGDVMRSGFEPIRRVRLTTPRGRTLEADVVGDDDRPGIGLSRSTLDDLLLHRAREAGATVFEGVRVGGPKTDGGRVVGVLGRHAAGPLEIHASLTVAANGRHSALVRQTGTVRGRSRLRPGMFGMKRHLRVDDESAAEPPGTVGLHLIPGGYIGTCRIEGDRTNLCGLLPESSARRFRGDLAALAAGPFRRNPALARLLDAAVPDGPWKTVAGVRVEVARPSLGGIAYAGDCRGTVDPLGGQGMTMALLGAELLIPFLLEALAADPGDLAWHRLYEAAWHRRFDRRIRLCRLFHHILVRPSLIDLASTWRTLAPRLLAAGYSRTRDPQIV